MQDYLAGAGEALRFYPGSPFDRDTYHRKLQEVQARFGPAEREGAARALRPTSDRARERLADFVARGGVLVTTGQQSGFLGGPLYTLYKALSAARLARALEAELGIPVIPVFWNASEDHDWDEVSHAYLAHASGLRRFDLPASDGRALPMSDRALPEGVEIVLDEVAQVIENEPFANETLTSIREAYRPGVSVAEAFARVMERLLQPLDFLMTDAADPAVKELSAGVLARAIAEAPAHERCLRERTEALVAAGYHAQVPILEHATNVFHHGSQGRERLSRTGEGVRAPESGRRWGVAELVDEIRAEPGRFSPNVLLRPVVESAVFPTLAYVGGPGEISYFAQLNALFPAFEMAPPVAYPRASVTLVERPMERLLEKLGLTIEDLSAPRHVLVERLARDAVPAEVRAALEALSGAVGEGYRRLVEAAAGVDPTLANAIGALRNESLSLIGRSERKILRRIKRREETRSRQLDRVRAHLRPGGEPQERVLNATPFLARYGPSLVEEILAALGEPWPVGAARAG